MQTERWRETIYIKRKIESYHSKRSKELMIEICDEFESRSKVGQTIYELKMLFQIKHAKWKELEGRPIFLNSSICNYIETVTRSIRPEFGRNTIQKMEIKTKYGPEDIIVIEWSLATEKELAR